MYWRKKCIDKTHAKWLDSEKKGEFGETLCDDDFWGIKVENDPFIGEL